MDHYLQGVQKMWIQYLITVCIFLYRSTYLAIITDNTVAHLFYSVKYLIITLIIIYNLFITYRLSVTDN